MTVIHPQETIIEEHSFKGIKVEAVDMAQTVWCGKVGYASDNHSEPDVNGIMNAYRSADHTLVNGAEKDWSACLSINYLCGERPNGLMVCDMVTSIEQPDCFDILTVPAGKYLRIRICDETARALGHEPWMGGIPPFGWIYDDIAPALGYTRGSDNLPIIEYYGFYNPDKYEHEYRYLYVPVQKTK